MKHVWIADVGLISSPSSGDNPARPRSPRSRVAGVSATLQRPQTGSPPTRTTRVVYRLPMPLTLTPAAAHQHRRKV